ncbi:TauD/TfdA family dioxygenase [Leucothrix pacifica]|uniref:TauD/TfdA-like domain-containing protein n=1 Tax=Leucothrix pacifica TaxID=1247513 RepID=A0A317CDS2_9GAMM|nr:TauD/TfdA family dioxygenase [Leucothrix pacifica]PWQ95483.1 hypothetical protein DKW60_14810 [Leucothrix pacifica]
MGIILKQKVTGPAAWRGSDLRNDQSWIFQLSKETIDTLDGALAAVKDKGLSFPHFSRDDFPIHSLSEELQRYAEEMENGKGFLLLSGLPIDRYSDDDINIIYYGIGLHMGTPVCQTLKGDLLGNVMNVGDITKKETRVYETNAYLPYHTDLSDVFGLICVRKAKSGGMTSLVSSGAVYNEILEHYPEYLGIFYRPMYYAHLGTDSSNKAPVFSYHDGKLSCRYLRQYIELGAELQERPLSRVEVEALDVFDGIIHDESIRLDMMLEPGDMLFANNYSVMHSRTSFEDFEEPEKRRKLVRLWVKMANARKLAPDFPGQNGFPPPE